MSEQMNEVALVKTLLEIPLFEDLEIKQISAILSVCKQREVSSGSVLCKPLTIDEQLLIFLQGRLRLESAEGDKLAEVTQVRVLGEMGVFTGQPRLSRVLAEEASVVLELEKADLVELIEDDMELGNQLLHSLVKLLYARTHNMNEDIVALGGRIERLQQRLAELAPDDPLLSAEV